MTTNKLSISLETPLADFIEQYQQNHGLRTRSEVISLALRLLREHELEQQYAEALAEWRDSGEAGAWESVVGDGLEVERATR